MTDPALHDALPGTPLELPVPPELAEALGYPGRARFVAFYISPFGDDLMHADGRDSGSGHSWTFLAYKRHWAVAGLLAPWDLGSPDTRGEFWLVLDRFGARASVAPAGEAETFLRGQHAPAPELTPDEARTLRAEIARTLDEWRTRAVDPDEVRRLMDEHRDRVERVMAFLDACPTAPEPPGRT
ncbi:Uncharacterized protein OS=Pelobacter propionicus (strain DSM 2379) GN=Ppro_3759 PE=4 SV=1 [Gemmata massiliana]|uniref:Uncharacterized protein n=1 Tax=Gemmata massiliana TaxID=1210884 RepID=A0A6P2DHD8_9BACT|nr:hypothetical protein [Gemmata massiliana]VTS00596.1 Uncharacterized protein OS=Pelobacter propionicus (strain DSM 2379) GN=Ppro_3759 PE=4 SV=1 [Gemmata massiliana]